MGNVYPGAEPRPQEEDLIEAIIHGLSVQDAGGGTVEEEKELLHSLIENSITAMFVVDCQHRVLIWNHACERLTGVPAADVLGTDGHWQAFHKEERPCLLDVVIDQAYGVIRSLYAGYRIAPLVPEGWQVEGWWESPGGDKRYLVFDAIPVYSRSGKLIGAAETIRDMTEHQRAVETLSRKEEEVYELQRLEAVSRLAGGVAHSFNNLLQAILGYSQLVKENLGAGHTASPDVDKIIRSGEKAAKLTQQLLAFSRGQMVKLGAINLNSVVLEAARLLRGTLGEHIELHVDLSKDLWSMFGDAVLMEQVVMNLAVNAREAMPRGGSLHISTANAMLDDEFCREHPGSHAGEHVVLKVKDAGCGMSEDTREHIFEPFFTTHDKSQRTGLGLSTVYGIIKQFGGQIHVHSERGVGTEFTIYVPAVDRPVEINLERADDAVLGSGERVLVMEDDASVRRLVCRVLDNLGYVTYQAADGEEALAFSQGEIEGFDLVLADVVMPRMGGREVVEKLRERRPDLKVIYTSGFTEGGLVERGLLESADPIILKPYTRETIAAKIRQVLDVRI